MPLRKNKQLKAWLGALFVKNLEKQAFPHLAVFTESETKHHHAKGRRFRHAPFRAARPAHLEKPTAADAPEYPEPAAPAVPEDDAVAAEAPARDEKESVPADAIAEASPALAEASAPAAGTPVRGAGKILKAAKAEERTASDEEVAALEQEEGFMQKVKLQKHDTAPRKGVSLWTMFRDRFAAKDVPAMRQASTEKAEPARMAEPAAPAETIDPKEDLFLKHASAAPSEPSIRTEATDLPAAPSLPARDGLFGAGSALDEVVSASAPAADLSKDAEKEPAAKEEVAKAIKDNADIADAPAPSEPPAPKAEKPAKKKLHIAQFESKKGFKAFLTSINYIGMGKERISFIQNMATMLNAGLPLTDALKTLVLETRNKPMRKLLGRIIDAVENGSPLWRAMEAQNFFSLHALALVRIGEEAGSLSENMGYLAEQDEKDNALRSKVKMAMIYPTIVMVIMFIIVVGLGMFVLPNLVGVLFSLNVELPLVTRIVIMASNAFTDYGAIGVPSFMAAFVLLAILSKYTRLKVVTQWIMFRIPGIGRLAREATIARFGVILGGLLKAGVPVIEALQSLVQVTPIASYKKLYAQMLAHITIGDSFAKSFASIKGSHKLLPPSVQQLVITGEKSGSLADIMLKIADIYDKKATGTAEKLPVILEPMLLLFIGGLVGSIAFAIIIPIYSIVGNVGG